MQGNYALIILYNIFTKTCLGIYLSSNFLETLQKINSIVKIIVMNFENYHQILVQAKSWNTLILTFFAPHYLHTKITY
jgi:hypothetical protein